MAREKEMAPSDKVAEIKKGYVTGRMQAESEKSLVDNRATNEAGEVLIGRRSRREKRANTRMAGFVTSFQRGQ